MEVTPETVRVIDYLRENGFVPYLIPNDYHNLADYVRCDENVSFSRLQTKITGLTDLLFSRRDVDTIVPVRA